MPGIVGIISIRKPIEKMACDFSNMIKELRYSEDELLRVIKGRRHLLAVANVNDGHEISKYFTNREETIDCIIDGDVFVSEGLARVLAEKYNIPYHSHWQNFVPYLYDLYGLNFADHIKGWFNIVIVDKLGQAWHIVNSRFGMRPLYYVENDGYFIFASNLRSILKCSNIKISVNRKAVVEYALFHYPLGDDTYIQNIRLLDPATIISIKNSHVTRSCYWHHENLFGNKILPFSTSIEGANDILEMVVNQMHEDTESFGVSLTGGFDGRTILSLLNKKPAGFFLYSFGTHQSRDVHVPKEISTSLNYEYIPIYLEGDYERRFFSRYAKIAIALSDGRSSIARTHYPYVAEMLSNRTRIILTGICGSELLRAFANVGAVVSNNARVLYAKGIDAVRQMLYDADKGPLKYYLPTLTSSTAEQLVGDVEALKAFNKRDLTLNQRLYVFILREVFRKYFGPEISMESPFVYNRFPFLDYEFVDFIFRTPFCGAYYDFFVQNPFVRIRGQQFYAHIIARHNKELAALQTDRMYTPRDLLSTTGRIKVAMKYFHRNLFYKPRNGYGILSGVSNFVIDNGDIFENSEFLSSERLLSDFKSGMWQNDIIEFCKALTFAQWCKQYLM